MDTRRLFLFLIFSFSSVMLWDAWQKHNAPKIPSVASTANENNLIPKPSASLQAKTELVSSTALGALPVIGTNASNSAEKILVKTDLFVAEISADGGEITRLELLNHRATTDKTKNLVLFDPIHRYAAQSGLIGEGLPNHRTRYRIVPGNRELGSNKDLHIRLEAESPDGVKVAKIIHFKRDSYQINISYELSNNSQKPIQADAYFQFQRDGKAPEGESSMVSTFTGSAIYTEAEKYQKNTFEDIGKNNAKYNSKADNGWLAIVQHYFVAAWLPAEKIQREFFMKKIDNDLYTTGVIVPLQVIAPSATGVFSMLLYAGPQEQAKIKLLAPGLDLVVDYGWLHIVAAPIFWMLEFIHGFVGNWGWAIVVLTILIKLVFFPLSAASYRSMAKMRQVTPKLMALKERFGDDRQKLNQEMMKLYQTEKINPLGGCLPIVVQIPVFISLYWVLLGGVEMRGAEWILWIKDLSAQDPYFVLPVIMVVSMIIQTKLNPTPPDPIQAKVMIAMPFIFGVMFFWFPAGLVLYWVVNNVLSIAQQWQITRSIEKSSLGGKALSK